VSRTSFTHEWGESTWDPFQVETINPSGSDSFAYSVVSGRGRVTGTGTGGNRREAALHRSALFGDQSEVRSLWWGGSMWDTGGSGATPQLGHIHGAWLDDLGVWRGYVVTNNIFLSDQNTINANLWSWPNRGPDPNGLVLGSRGASKVMPVDRQMALVGRARVFFFGWLNQYYVSPPERLVGLVPGLDRITIDSLDSTFDETSILVAGVDVAASNVSVVEAVHTSGSGRTTDSGTVTPVGARRYWPYWMATVLDGPVMRAKCWRLGDPEPDWSDPTNVVTADFVGANLPTPAVDRIGPRRGYSGVIAAHLRNGAYLEFGDLSFSGS
jgi:hypothetical protein